MRGAEVRSLTATALAVRDVHDHNTFEQPEIVVPTTATVAVDGSPFVYEFPAASVTKLEIDLGR